MIGACSRDGYHLPATTIARALPKNAKRVLCLGDSLTYGIGVSFVYYLAHFCSIYVAHFPL